MKNDDIPPEDPIEGEDINELSDLLGAAGGNHLTPESKNYPDSLPVLAITNTPYMPFMAVPLIIEPGPYLELLQEVSKMDNKYLCLVLTKDKDQDIYEAELDDLYDVGVVAQILRIHRVEGAGAQVILNIEKRVKLLGPATNKKTKHLVAKVEYHEEVVPPGKKDVLKAYSASLISTIKEIVSYNTIYKDEFQILLTNHEFAQPYKLVDFIVALTTSSREEKQDILSTWDILERAEKALILAKKEVDLGKLQKMINSKIEGAISATQREFHLREQLKQIQKELNINKDDKTVDLEKFDKRAEKLKFTEEAQATFDEERDKLSMLDVQSAEYSVVRGYLDWLTLLPWGVLQKENENLAKAEEILEEDHYGLTDVKERIVEVIASKILNKSSVAAPIICLVGPPGVGKTSIGKSIARALNREFYRFSVGGMRDDAEIKGHRRTYVGAMPGKILQALKQTKSSNPVIMLDEVDKVKSTYHGDPASALLEVLDPEQNSEFLDHYLDVRFDLSKIMFVVTANSLDTIPPALLDRMEVIRLSGYVGQEKIEIAKKYLIPRNRKNHGLKSTDIHFSSEALQYLIVSYCREAGVRNFEKSLKKVMRKVATEKVREMESTEEKKKKAKPKKKTINKQAIEKYLGPPIFSSEKIYAKDKHPGITTGLAWTQLGGSILTVETAKIPGKNRLQITGNNGDIMKESSKIAYSYLMSERDKFLPKDCSFEDEEIQIHIPDGATPKDGPSAGITLTTAMISLCTGKPVSQNLAMTGEITLTGKVLPIGGLKEKIIAARREKIYNVIIPKENKRDFHELADYLTEGMNFFFVENYEEVYDIAFKKKLSAKKKSSSKRVK